MISRSVLPLVNSCKTIWQAKQVIYCLTLANLYKGYRGCKSEGKDEKNQRIPIEKININFLNSHKHPFIGAECTVDKLYMRVGYFKHRLGTCFEEICIEGLLRSTFELDLEVVKKIRSLKVLQLYIYTMSIKFKTVDGRRTKISKKEFLKRYTDTDHIFRFCERFSKVTGIGIRIEDNIEFDYIHKGVVVVKSYTKEVMF